VCIGNWTGLYEFDASLLKTFFFWWDFGGRSIIFFCDMAAMYFVFVFLSALQMKTRPSIFSTFCAPPMICLGYSTKSVMSRLALFEVHFKDCAGWARVSKSALPQPWRRCSPGLPRGSGGLSALDDDCAEEFKSVNGQNIGERTRAH